MLDAAWFVAEHLIVCFSYGLAGLLLTLLVARCIVLCLPR
jgi:hypothetical protein